MTGSSNLVQYLAGDRALEAVCESVAALTESYIPPQIDTEGMAEGRKGILPGSSLDIPHDRADCLCCCPCCAHCWMLAETLGFAHGAGLNRAEGQQCLVRLWSHSCAHMVDMWLDLWFDKFLSWLSAVCVRAGWKHPSERRAILNDWMTKCSDNKTAHSVQPLVPSLVLGFQLFSEMDGQDD